MTQNQLRFQANVESVRHNREMERLGAEELPIKMLQAQASQGQAAASLSQAATAASRAQEEARHNVVAERQNRAKVIMEGVSTAVDAGTKIAKFAASTTAAQDGGRSAAAPLS